MCCWMLKIDLVIALNAAEQIKARPDASILVLRSAKLPVGVLQFFGHVEDARHLVSVIHLQPFQ